MIIHPPMQYVGWAGFSVPFAFAIAALLDGHIDARWLRWVRPWTNVAWAFLTVGIALGSWWAYYELGWGGWWFWDPVENAAFMPWLVGAALIHSQAVTEKRGSFPGWTLLLAIAAFSLSLMGTFLVRSGVLTSVHAFAADPSRGLFILVFLGLVIGGSLLLYALRAGRLDPGAGFRPASRETLLLLNNLLLASACAMILLGTLYPLLADALELGKISVGPPYFGLLFFVLMAPLLALVPLGPLVRWQRDQASKVAALLLPWLGLALVAGAVAYFAAPQGSWKTAAGVAGAAWVGLGTLRFVWARLRNSGRLTAEMWGMVLAHLGLAVFVVGALLVEAQNVQREVALKPDQALELGRYAFRFEGVDQLRGPNYLADRGHVQVLRDGRPLALLHPEKRAYASGGQVMTEAGIRPAAGRGRRTRPLPARRHGREGLVPARRRLHGSQLPRHRRRCAAAGALYRHPSRPVPRGPGGGGHRAHGRRRVRGRERAGQARRDLHAQGSGRQDGRGAPEARGAGAGTRDRTAVMALAEDGSLEQWLLAPLPLPWLVAVRTRMLLLGDQA